MDKDSTDSWDDSADESDGLFDVWDDSLWKDPTDGWNADISAEDKKKRKKFLHGDPPTIDWEVLKSKLSNNTAVPTLNLVPPWLRVIDVDRKRVVRAPTEPFDYVCLSYTWGDVRDFQATSANIIKLSEDGALDKPENPDEPEGPDNPKVPATIQDSMTACQHLGQKYLWVDRLCIVQDRPEKRSHFDDMGRIYNHAFATLVAFEGRNARHGLHGISKPIDLSASEVDFWTRSEWSKRGWTYQEAILSRRMIFFAMDGIFLEHEKEATLTTEVNGSETDLFRPMFHGAIDYYFAVETYTKRELGLQGDIVNAFAGICNHLFDKVHQFGIPINDFNNAMHWLANDVKREERILNDGYMFPTWSWASIKGQIFYPRVIPALPIASWACVNSPDNHGNLSLSYSIPHKAHKDLTCIRVKLRDLDYNSVPVGREDAVFQELYQDLNASPSPNPNQLDPFKTTLKDCLQNFTKYASFWQFSREIELGSQKGTFSFDQYLNQQNARSGTLRLAQGLTLAYSLTSNLRIYCPTTGSSLRLLTRDSACIGHGYFDDPRFLSSPRKRDGPEHPNHRVFTFLVLSISMIARGEISRIFSPGEYRYPDGHSPCEVLLNSPDEQENLVLNVIALEKSEKMDAFDRVGFGFINLKKWLELGSTGSEWRTIALQ